MRRSAILLALLAFVLTAVSSLPGAWACTCLGYPNHHVPLVTDHEEADVMFEGRVVSSEPWGERPEYSFATHVTTFDVEVLLKGEAGDPVRVVHDGSSSCGSFFEPGERWIITADRTESGEYATHICDPHGDYDLLPPLPVAAATSVS